MDQIQRTLLEEVADLHGVPAGAYNIRANGQMAGRNTTANIDIITKEDKSGIDIRIKEGTKNESVHIPVVLSQSGMTEMVYNDFYIGDNADVTIIAGCGIHNGGDAASEHDGIHRFFIGRNARVRYVEKHYAVPRALGHQGVMARPACRRSQAVPQSVAARVADHARRRGRTHRVGRGAWL